MYGHNRMSVYDPNLSSAAQYSPPSYSNANEASNDDHNVSPSTAEFASNCVTYSNVMFVPTTATNNGEIKQTAEQLPSHAYILADARYLNHEDAAHTADAGTISYDGQMVATTESTSEGNVVIINHNSHIETYHSDGTHQQNIHEIDMHPSYLQCKRDAGTTEIIFQGANGQLYKHIPNLYGAGTDASTTIELIPALISEAIVGAIDYNSENGGVFQAHADDHHANNLHQRRDTAAYEIHSTLHNNVDDGSKEMVMMSNVASSNHPSVELIFQNYKNCGTLETNINAEYTNLEPNAHHNIMSEHPHFSQEMIDMNACASGEIHEAQEVKSSYQPIVPMSLLEKEQQRILLESTMSPLCKCIPHEYLHKVILIPFSQYFSGCCDGYHLTGRALPIVSGSKQRK